MLIRFYLVFLVFLQQNSNPKTVQEFELDNTSSKLPVVTVLGLFHFHPNNSDDYKPSFSFDILEKERQKELESLIHSLIKFNPTKIIVEVSRDRQELLNDDYAKYLKDDKPFNNKRNEIFQIGFKLGKRLGHKRIYASDNIVSWFGENVDWNNYNANEHRIRLGQEEKYQDNYQKFEKLARFEDSLKTVKTLKEFLIHANNPMNSKKSHNVYLSSTVITGAGENYFGADAVARWYRRNIHIYSNVYDLTEKDDRILVLYGIGHLHILRQLFVDSPVFDFHEINEYLK